MPCPGQDVAVPADHDSLTVGAAGRPVDNARINSLKDLYPGHFTVSHIEGFHFDYGVLDVLNTVRANRLVIDRDAATGNPCDDQASFS